MAIAVRRAPAPSAKRTRVAVPARAAKRTQAATSAKAPRKTAAARSQTAARKGPAPGLQSYFYVVETLPSLYLADNHYMSEGSMKVGHAGAPSCNTDNTVVSLGQHVPRLKEYLRSNTTIVLTMSAVLGVGAQYEDVLNPNRFIEETFEKQLHAAFDGDRSRHKFRYDGRSGCELYARPCHKQVMTKAAHTAKEKGFFLVDVSDRFVVDGPYLVILRHNDTYSLPRDLAEVLMFEGQINPDHVGEFMCHCERLGVRGFDELLKVPSLELLFLKTRQKYKPGIWQFVSSLFGALV